MSTRSRAPTTQDLGAVLVANLLLRLSSSATGVMVTLFLAQINRELYEVPATVLGLMASAYFLVEMIGAPLFGAASDRHGRRWYMVGGALIAAFAVQLTALTMSLPLLFVARLLEGLAAASSTPSILGHLAAKTEHDPALRGRVMSWFEVGTALGVLAGTVAGSVLWATIDRPGFSLLGVAYLVCAALFWLTREPLGVRAAAARERAGLRHSVRRLLGFRPLFRFAPAWLFVNAAAGLWLTHAVYQMTAGRDLPGQYLVGAFSDATVSYVLGGYAVTFSVGAFLWGLTFRRLTEVTVMRIALIGILVAAAAILIVNHSGGPGVVLWLGVGLFGAAVLVESGFPPAAVSYLARLSGGVAGDRGLLMGLYSVLLGLGQLVGGWLGGPVADWWGMDGILGLTFALTGISVVLAFALPTTVEHPVVPDACETNSNRSHFERHVR